MAKPNLNAEAGDPQVSASDQASIPSFSPINGMFAGAIAWGAFLLFAVQPIMGKFILPWFGGSSAVWTTCLLFFQVALLVGYAYAHANVRLLGLRYGAMVHGVLLLASLFLLPVTPSDNLRPQGDHDPILWIIFLLARTVGLPYVLLAANGPLLQAWLGRTRSGMAPYRLYALSNLASLLALAAYPVAIERLLPRGGQTLAWSVGFVVFVLICAGASLAVLFAKSTASVSLDANAAPRPPAPKAIRLVLWLLLPMCASILLLATTAKLSQEVAVIPFLWVLPLGLYLISFIICFDRPAWYLRRTTLVAMTVAIAGTCWMMSIDWGVWLGVQIPVFCLGLFVCCIACHGELVRIQPATEHLTAYYLMMSAGGALGGLFVAVLAPHLFNTIIEIQIGWIAAAVVVAAAFHIDASSNGKPAKQLRLVWLCPVIVLAGMMIFWPHDLTGQIVSRQRNFYGVLSVTHTFNCSPQDGELTFYHGSISHGLQLQGVLDTKKLPRIPTLYYTPFGGGGRSLLALRTPQPMRVGFVGMGIGTLAVYARPGDYYRFYEIDPDVVKIANERFSFLKDCAGKTDVVVGDARLNMEGEPDQQFDAILLDAFSGDTIPVHLLTAECFQTYLRHLKPGGVIALHASNDYLDLYPVMTKLADHLGLKSAYLINEKGQSAGWCRSEWMIFSTNADFIDSKVFKDIRITRTNVDLSKIRLWTDEDTNLFEIFRWD